MKIISSSNYSNIIAHYGQHQVHLSLDGWMPFWSGVPWKHFVWHNIQRYREEPALQKQ